MKYGIFILRGQPFHKGHQHIIDKIIEDGLEPVVILGSAQEYGTVKNPYSVAHRANMIRIVYPEIIIGAISDYDCNDTWLEALLALIGFYTNESLNHSTIYLHQKLEDLQNFTFRGIDYTNESYCKIYEIAGLHTTTLPLSDIQVRAKAIREDLEGNKEYLEPEIYKYIKELQ